MRKSKITAGIITKNEERNITDCINTVKGWADEIIVVDGYSADKTAQIAENLGAKVIKRRFEDDFSKERNAVMDASSGDWVLHMDADERVTPEFKRKTDEVIDKSNGINSYKFRRKNFFLGHAMEHGGFCHYIPNLVRRASVRFEGALHERPVHKGDIGTIEADIEHYPFESIAQFVERHNRYSSVEAEEIFKLFKDAKLNEVKKNAIRVTFKKFWKMYVKKKGYKEGMYGIAFSVLFAFTNFLIWVKYWELCKKNNE